MLSKQIARYGFLLLVFAVCAAAQPGISAADYLAFKFISDPQLSPDGRLVAYVQTSIDPIANRRTSAIWTVPADGSGAPAAFTAPGPSANSPRWSPDSQFLAYLAGRQIQVMPANAAGGESKK